MYFGRVSDLASPGGGVFLVECFFFFGLWVKVQLTELIPFIGLDPHCGFYPGVRSNKVILWISFDPQEPQPLTAYLFP